MFNIITKSPTNQEGSIYEVVISPANELILTHLPSTKSIIVTIDSLKTYNGALVVQWSSLYGFILSGGDDLINDKALHGYIQYAKNIEYVVAAIVPNSQKTKAAAVFYTKINYSGEVTINDKPNTTAEAVELVFPGHAAQRMRFRNAKIDLLRGVSAYDSLSSLEKQVDLLSKLVLVMASKLDLPTETSTIEALTDILSKADSNTGSTPAQIAAKVEDFKVKLRQKQLKYFEDRNKP